LPVIVPSRGERERPAAAASAGGVPVGRTSALGVGWASAAAHAGANDGDAGANDGDENGDASE
jgi:hypothetical protein